MYENWKPPRTYHCSKQGHCVHKMDHYCPISLTTIGHKNHRNFYLFLVWHTLGCLYGCIVISSSIVFYFIDVFSTSLVWPGLLNLLKAILWLSFSLLHLSALIAFFRFAYIMLAQQTYMILHNHTTLDDFKHEEKRLQQWTDQNPFGSLGPPKHFYEFSNFFMGKLHSLKVVGFLSNFFPFLPLETISKYEGYHFDARGKSKEQVTIRKQSYLACF